MHKFSEVISYFSLQSWTFHDDNTRSLIKKMSKLDQSLFKFDISKLSWNEYFKKHVLGIRLYIIKDTIDSVPEALKRTKKSVNTIRKIGHYFFITSNWRLLFIYFFNLCFQIVHDSLHVNVYIGGIIDFNSVWAVHTIRVANLNLCCPKWRLYMYNKHMYYININRLVVMNFVLYLIMMYFTFTQICTILW